MIRSENYDRDRDRGRERERDPVKKEDDKLMEEAKVTKAYLKVYEEIFRILILKLVF